MLSRPTGLLTGSFLRSHGCESMAPANLGSNDIYLMDIASKQWVQLTHDSGRNDYPSWSPDGRHIVFQSSRDRPRANLDDAGRRNECQAVNYFGS